MDDELVLLAAVGQGEGGRVNVRLVLMQAHVPPLARDGRCGEPQHLPSASEGARRLVLTASEGERRLRDIEPHILSAASEGESRLLQGDLRLVLMASEGERGHHLGHSEGGDVGDAILGSRVLFASEEDPALDAQLVAAEVERFGRGLLAARFGRVGHLGHSEGGDIGNALLGSRVLFASEEDPALDSQLVATEAVRLGLVGHLGHSEGSDVGDALLDFRVLFASEEGPALNVQLVAAEAERFGHGLLAARFGRGGLLGNSERGEVGPSLHGSRFVMPNKGNATRDVQCSQRPLLGAARRGQVGHVLLRTFLGALEGARALLAAVLGESACSLLAAVLGESACSLLAAVLDASARHWHSQNIGGFHITASNAWHGYAVSLQTSHMDNGFVVTVFDAWRLGLVSLRTSHLLNRPMDHHIVICPVICSSPSAGPPPILPNSEVSFLHLPGDILVSMYLLLAPRDAAALKCTCRVLYLTLPHLVCYIKSPLLLMIHLGARWPFSLYDPQLNIRFVLPHEFAAKKIKLYSTQGHWILMEADNKLLLFNLSNGQMMILPPPPGGQAYTSMLLQLPGPQIAGLGTATTPLSTRFGFFDGESWEEEELLVNIAPFEISRLSAPILLDDELYCLGVDGSIGYLSWEQWEVIPLTDALAFEVCDAYLCEVEGILLAVMVGKRKIVTMELNLETRQWHRLDALDGRLIFSGGQQSFGMRGGLAPARGCITLPLLNRTPQVVHAGLIENERSLTLFAYDHGRVCTGKKGEGFIWSVDHPSTTAPAEGEFVSATESIWITLDNDVLLISIV